MKKFTEKALAVIMVVMMLCSSMALSFGAYAAETENGFVDSYGVEYKGDIYYARPGEEIDFDDVLNDSRYDFVGLASLDYNVVEDVWDEEGTEILSVNAIDNGVTLVNIWCVIEDEIIDDYYALVVVSDGTDLGSVDSIEVDDIVVGYEQEVYVSPTVYSESEDAYYFAFFDCEDTEAPFIIWNDGSCSGYDSGKGEAICYVIDAQGDIFVDTFEVEVEGPSSFVKALEFFAWIIDILFEIALFFGL